MVADDLRRQADNFIDVADLADVIARKYAERPAPAAVGNDDYDDYDDDDDDDDGEAIVIRTT
jgi:hypothetical protein